MTLIDVPAGLKGVAVAETAIGAVDGARGFYHYRDHDAVELARTRSLEDVWALLIDGTLPEPSVAGDPRTSLADAIIDGRLAGAEVDDQHVAAVARATSTHHHGLLALLPLLDVDPTATLDQDVEARRRAVIRTAAAVPTLLAAAHAHRVGRRPVAPDGSRSHAADWLWMATGNEPTEAAVALVETYLVSTIDHGFNPSTFTTRVVTSTGADVVSSLCAGVAALSGPLHGGAPGRALDMINDIGDPLNTERWVIDRLDRGEKIMGFGHAVYRADDPRSMLLRSMAERYAGELGADQLVGRAIEIERRTLDVLRGRKPDATIVTNVEFYAGVVLHLAGMTPDLFTPSFTVSRAIGWSAHLLEQAGNNKILRPSARYIGPPPRQMATPSA